MENSALYKDQLQFLKQLQTVDSEIFDLSEKKDVIPDKILEITGSVESKKTAMNAAEEKLKNLQVLQKEKENDLQAAEDKIVKHEGELAQIKTNKEYSAMLEQIQSLRADVSQLEENIIQAIDSVEDARNELEAEKEKYQQEAAKSDEEVRSIKSEESELQRAISELEAKRQNYAHKIEPEILARYEMILGSRGRTALAPIRGNNCGECFIMLRPQVINDVKLMKDPVVCESCGRILYPED